MRRGARPAGAGGGGGPGPMGPPLDPPLPSAVLSTKLGSTLIRKPIATVSLHRQRTSRRQRANLHQLVNGDVYGSRILIATPTSLSHVRATR